MSNYDAPVATIEISSPRPRSPSREVITTVTNTSRFKRLQRCHRVSFRCCLPDSLLSRTSVTFNLETPKIHSHRCHQNTLNLSTTRTQYQDNGPTPQSPCSSNNCMATVPLPQVRQPCMNRGRHTLSPLDGPVAGYQLGRHSIELG